MISDVFTKDNEIRVARGTALEAREYFPPLMDSYGSNPLIQALPPLKNLADFTGQVVNSPDWSPNYQKKNWHERAQMPIAVKQFFFPFPRHYTLAQGIYTLISAGYQGRNPMTPQWRSETQARLTAVKRTPESYLPDTMETAMLTGMSGLGKSISVARLLQRLLPQVIVHKSFNGNPFPHTQIVWLYISCPHSASALQLSSQFLREVDMALKSVDKEASFQSKHVRQHSSAPSVFSGLCEVALEFSLGLVVIDEIQNLTGLGFGGAKLLLNFIVQLQNTLGVPILLVGNGSINYLLAESFRLIRRTAYLPDPHWGRLKQTSAEWENFITQLWNFQYLSEKTPLTDEIKDAFYAHSAGIPDIAGDLFKFVQMRAINNRQEVITKELIHDEARRALPRETRTLVDALINRRYSVLGRFEDLHISDFDSEGLTDAEYDSATVAMAQAREQKERGIKRKAARDGHWVPGARG